MGIEPTSSAWKAEVLPLNYTRLLFQRLFYQARTKSGSLLLLRQQLNRPNLKIYQYVY